MPGWNEASLRQRAGLIQFLTGVGRLGGWLDWCGLETTRRDGIRQNLSAGRLVRKLDWRLCQERIEGGRQAQALSAEWNVNFNIVLEI